ncbi:hypothetical protein GALMADRAFT_1234697 [Galerina marginata CBS 339.88]|uniref:Uncharacterized protein n=1 Tax=Galerina marginata (strain CBS 339.88) TaxID=685588 RepID=A0A067T804_GALM3|nr:hypothetical protein GALMADRAFT_1234697 [Galerina marginata CBS 339.88]
MWLLGCPRKRWALFNNSKAKGLIFANAIVILAQSDRCDICSCQQKQSLVPATLPCLIHTVANPPHHEYYSTTKCLSKLEYR